MLIFCKYMEFFNIKYYILYMQVSIITLPENIETLILKNSFTFGRNKKSDIVIDDTFISRRHCRIFLNNDKYFLEDLKSQNGTFVNGILIKDAIELKNNDVISLYSNGPMYQFRISQNKLNFIKNPVKNILHTKNFRFILPILFVLLIIIGFYTFKKFNFLKNNNQINSQYSQVKLRFKFYKIMKKYEENYYHLDKILFKKIVNYIDYYDNSTTFKEAKKRRIEYKNMIEKIFKKNKIPVDLSYIAFVESDFQPKAYNRYSGARGLWQLMPGTARQYGLKVNKYVDERIDPNKSTEATASYINDLIAIFGLDSFLLVLAAYNAGEGTISNSLRMIDDPKKDRSFWYLYKNNLIPEETKEYVLKVLALMILCEDQN